MAARLEANRFTNLERERRVFYQLSRGKDRPLFREDGGGEDQRDLGLSLEGRISLP